MGRVTCPKNRAEEALFGGTPRRMAEYPMPEGRDLLWKMYRLEDIAWQVYDVPSLARMWGHR